MSRPKLTEVTPLGNARNPVETLEQILADHGDSLEYVAIIAMHKDRSRSIFTSMASLEEKALLKCFWDHWVLDWFRNE